MSTEPAARVMLPTRVRYVVLVLLALAPISAYLTRTLSASNTTIAAEFDVSDEVMGDVLAGFALGYFFFQVPGGMLASSFGVRVVLPVLGIAWCLCAIWSSLALSAAELHFAQVALGFAQAGLVPCCARAAADWFPLARRGIVSAVLAGSMQVGAVTATALTARLLDPLGWRIVLQAYAAFGIAWALTFFLWFRNCPEEHRRVNRAEEELIRAGRSLAETAPQASPPAAAGDWFRLTLAVGLSSSFWAYFLQAAFRAYSYAFFGTWCPAYLEKAYRLNKVEAGELATWPLVAFGVGSLVGGFVVDAILVRTGSRWLSRSGSAVVGLGVCAGCFAVATRSDDVYLVIVLLSLGCLFAALAGPATWAAGMDLGGRHTAVIFGVMNMAGNVGAYLCPKQVGRLFVYVETSGRSWGLVLWLFVGINIAGAVMWVFVDPRRPVGEEGPSVDNQPR
ncbi:MAG: MFS transporter [Planctomycetes bacterium]|nr:MFS transporter [Planctomycetota bacterium]